MTPPKRDIRKFYLSEVINYYQKEKAMNKKKGNTSRILAILCALAMIVTAFPAGLWAGGAYAADENASVAAEAEPAAGENEAEEPGGADQAEPQEQASQPENDQPSVEGESKAEEKPVVQETEPEKEITEPAENAEVDKEEAKAEEKAETEEPDAKEDTAEEDVFKVRFDFAENYANFNQINDETTEPGGKFTLPKKPEARKTLYKAGDGKEYYFTGWKYDGEEYEPGDAVVLDSDTVFKAVWKQTYTIEFSTKGIVADEVESQTEVYGEPVVLPDETAKKAGYDFIGWTPDKGETVFAPGTSIAASRIQPSRSKAQMRLLGVTEDTSRPDVYIEIEEHFPNEEDPIMGYATFKVTAFDKGSGVDKVEITNNDTGDTGWQEISNGEVVKGYYNRFLHARAFDKAGNKSEPTFVIVTTGMQKHSAAEFTDIKVDGKEAIAQDGEIDASNVAKKEHTIGFSLSKEVSALRAYIDDKEITGDIAGDYASGYTLNLSGDDLNGEKTVSIVARSTFTHSDLAIKLAFDNAKPSVKSFSMKGGNSFGYYNASGDWTLEAEADKELASAEFNIGGEKFPGKVEGKKASATITKEEVEEKFKGAEGEYEISVAAKDTADNENEEDDQKLANVEAPEGLYSDNKIIIDTVAPKLTKVETTPSSLLDPKDNNYYYQKAASTTYTIKDSYPDTMNLSYKKDGESTDPIVEKEKNTITADWKGDFTYSDITLTATDKAGNLLENGSTPSTEDTVTVENGIAAFTYGKVIDTKAPQVTVNYDSNAKLYVYEDGVFVNDTVSFKLSIEKDDNLDKDAVSVKLLKDGVIDPKTTIAIDTAEDGKLEAEGVICLKDSEGLNDGEYCLQITGTDRAGHAVQITEVKPENAKIMSGKWPDAKEDNINVKFVLDNTAPKYTSSDFSEVSEGASPDGNTAYYQNAVSGKFTINENNFAENRIIAGYTKADGKQYSKVELKWPDKPSATGKCKGKTYTVETPDEAGVYRLLITGEDKAGNLLEKEKDDTSDIYNETEQNADGQFWSFNKVVDKDDPGYILSISDTQGEYYRKIVDVRDKDAAGEEKYKPFRKNRTASIVVKGDDASPVKVSYDILAIDSNGKAGEWKKVNDIPYTADYADNLSVPSEKSGETQFKVANITVMDRSGRKVELGMSNPVYLDGTRPVNDIIQPIAKIKSTTAITKRVQNKDLYNKSVNLSFEVSDPNENKSSSGLAKVWYEAYIDGTVVDKGELDGTDGYFLNLSESEAEQAAKEDKLTYKKNAAITIPAKSKYESNNIRIVLHAIDNAGNETSTSTVFGIDSVGPEIVISYDNNSVKNEKYFKANRTATVTVTERNLGTYSKKVNIKTEVGVPGSWSYSEGGSASGNNDKWIKRLYYTKDGTYNMTVSGTDALGNPAHVTYTGTANRHFVIDKTAPLLAVYFDNNSVRNGKYYNADRVATIDIRELNFRDSDVTIKGKATAPRGGAMGFPSRSGFSSSGINRFATIPFVREGRFNFDVDFVDLAGNKAKTVSISEFVIDKTKPTVRIENVIDGGIYRNSVAPRAVFDDDNFSLGDSSFRFTGVRKIDRSELVSAFRSNGEYGGVYILNDIPQIRANDDIYTAYATSTDMAGNTTTVQVIFSVNRFGSTYDYNNDKTTENLVAKKTGRFYTNKAEDLQLREINVNHIKNYSLTLDRGGNSVKLKEGKDYTVTKKESEQGVQYIYKISKDVVTDEGSYNIVAKSEDEAGNINTNAAIRSENKDSEVPVRFVYDVTKPVINVVDPGNNKVIELKKSPYYGISALDIGIKPDDDWALGGKIKLILRDGENEYVEEYSGKEFWEIMGENSDKKFFPETIKSGSRTKTLDVTVWDAAGNEETAHYDITVLNGVGDVARRYWYLLLLLLGVAAGGYAYYRHRKNDDDDEKEDDAA